MTWDMDPILFQSGSIAVRWYGVLFASGFLFGTEIMRYFYRKEGRDERDVSRLFTYVFFGTLIGARLGHCLFYEPGVYLSNPIEIFKIWKGGLASHGAYIGVCTAVWLYSRNKKDQNILWIADRLAIVGALCGSLIRVGNFFNSEILGTVTNVPWAIRFMRGDGLPRHPAQLYEAIAYFIFFWILIYFWKHKRETVQNGFYFGFNLVLVFGFRFFVEFVKAEQVSFEVGMLVNMGQILSIPAFLAGAYLMVRKPASN